MDYTDYDTRLAAYALVVDSGRVLLSWFNGGAGGGVPGWTLPGGGVDYDETVEQAVRREVREETGLDVEPERVLLVHSLIGDGPTRPYKSVRVVFLGRVTGGRLGTLEVGGSTDRAAWLALPDVAHSLARTDLVDVALAALAELADLTDPRTTD